MSSLVAYDDSDSETDTGTSEDALHGEANLASPTMTTVGSRSGFDAISERRIQSVDYTAGSTKNVFHNDPLLYHMQADKKSSAVAHPAALQMATCSPGQWLSSMQKPRVLSENENYSQKRAPGDCEPTLQGLRPYIPKRLRQEKDPKEGGDSANKSANLGVAGDGMSIEISKYIVPYIGSNYGVTAIPTSLVFHMSEHRDPVNVVRWCPVQKWGHMLLSASMDKTVKVIQNRMDEFASFPAYRQKERMLSRWRIKYEIQCIVRHTVSLSSPMVHVIFVVKCFCIKLV
uniref:Uncharacterized protein n=1 Tax=Sphaerodactylus townsendi TaxID=933632 RepID=A0ACB8G5H5_9SAUR